MLKSMTAYGRASLAFEGGDFVVEIQSLNKKHLELFVQLPREFSLIETEIRKWIGSCIHRGKVTVKISAVYHDKTPVTVLPNLPLVRQLKNAWEKIAQEINQEKVPSLLLQLFANEPGILTYEYPANEGEYASNLKEAINQALENLIKMKQREGEALLAEFKNRIEIMSRIVEKISSLSGNSTEKYREKLKKHIEEVLPNTVENDERVLREICLYADRIDITEELTRLRSHLSQFNEILHSSEDAKGKTLDFLLLEMLREVNTIGAKSDDLGITQCVLHMKGDIEKIREQLNNVE